MATPSFAEPAGIWNSCPVQTRSRVPRPAGEQSGAPAVVPAGASGQTAGPDLEIDIDLDGAGPEPAAPDSPAAEPDAAEPDAAEPGVAEPAQAEAGAAPSAATRRLPDRWRAPSRAALLGMLSWLLPTVVAGFVVSYQASRPQLWRDEFASWSAATRTVPQIIELGQHIDGVTVPYYLFLHHWIGWFGDSTLSMRMPSIIAMTATAGVVALLGRRLYGNRAGLLAGLLVSAAPVASRYGQEARGYALAALFATLATLLLVLALARPRRWLWACYAVSVALLGLSHQVGLLVLIGHLAAALTYAGRRGRRRLLWWALSAGAGMAVVAPIALNGLGQHGTQLSWLGPATLHDLGNMPGVIFESALVGGALCAIAAFALPRRGERGRHDTWSRLLWLSALVPYAVLYAIDQLIAPLFLGRYLLFVVPLLCVLAGRALSLLRLPTALAVGLVVAAVGLPAQVDARTTHSNSDYRAVADLLANFSRPGDGAIYAPRSGWEFTDEAMRYYLRDRAPTDVLMERSEVQNASLWANECGDGAACVFGTPRVWAVIADDSAYPGLPGTLQYSASATAALATYRRAERWDFEGFAVVLYLPRPARPSTGR
jgi:mannosyltransferase